MGALPLRRGRGQYGLSASGEKEPMSEPRLKTEFWVKAQLRLCDQAFLPAVVVRRGDADAGQVLIRLDRRDGRCELLARRFSDDGARVWRVVAQGGAACDAYILREADIDPDVWVLEIEDPQDRYLPDGQTPQA